jgi:hypothetical protein
MAPPDDRTRTPAPHAEEAKAHGLLGTWLNTLVGVGLLVYTCYWVQHPSAQALGRFLRPLYRLWGKWPIALVFAAGGLFFLSIGLTRLVGRNVRKR